MGLPALWVLLEWVRGWLLSGFGWLSLGYAHTDTWLAGFAPLGGIHAVSAIVLLMAGALVALWQGAPRERLVAAALVLVPWPVGVALDRVAWTEPVGSPNAQSERFWRDLRMSRAACSIDHRGSVIALSTSNILHLPTRSKPKTSDCNQSFTEYMGSEQELF